ncbi:hypothetical protein [robinz microvirus RP_35]|nr:hypothetical protein [robinz microvirus RP_35]
MRYRRRRSVRRVARRAVRRVSRRRGGSRRRGPMRIGVRM